MDDRTFGDALKTVAQGLGLRLLESLSGRLNPDELIQQANTVLGGEIKEAVKEVLQDTDSASVRELIDRLFEELDEDKVISAIAKPLVTELVEWFKTDASELLANAIVDALNLDELNGLVAEKIANRVQIVPTQ